MYVHTARPSFACNAMQSVPLGGRRRCEEPSLRMWKGQTLLRQASPGSLQRDAVSASWAGDWVDLPEGRCSRERGALLLGVQE